MDRSDSVKARLQPPVSATPAPVVNSGQSFKRSLKGIIAGKRCSDCYCFYVTSFREAARTSRVTSCTQFVVTSDTLHFSLWQLFYSNTRVA